MNLRGLTNQSWGAVFSLCSRHCSDDAPCPKKGIVLLCSRHWKLRNDWGDRDREKWRAGRAWNRLLSHTHHQASREDESTTYTSILLIAIAKYYTAAVPEVARVEKYPSFPIVTCAVCPFFVCWFSDCWIVRLDVLSLCIDLKHNI